MARLPAKEGRDEQQREAAAAEALTTTEAAAAEALATARDEAAQQLASTREEAAQQLASARDEAAQQLAHFSTIETARVAQMRSTGGSELSSAMAASRLAHNAHVEQLAAAHRRELRQLEGRLEREFAAQLAAVEASIRADGGVVDPPVQLAPSRRRTPHSHSFVLQPYAGLIV